MPFVVTVYCRECKRRHLACDRKTGAPLVFETRLDASCLISLDTRHGDIWEGKTITEQEAERRTFRRTEARRTFKRVRRLRR